jgi:hypothetical protein
MHEEIQRIDEVQMTLQQAMLKGLQIAMHQIAEE